MKTKQEILDRIEILETSGRDFIVGTREWYAITAGIGGLRWVLEGKKKPDLTVQMELNKK